VLEELAAHDVSLKVIHTLTHSRPDGWGSYDRRIDAKMLVEVVAATLMELGYDPEHVKTERLGPTGG
jgi:hypothetical protein